MSTLIKPEIIEGMPDTQYHAETGLGKGKFVSRSMLFHYHNDPPGFKLAWVDNHPYAERKQNEGQKFGEYVEDHLLNGNVSRWAIRPDTYTNDKGEVKDWNKNANVCKAWHKANPCDVMQDQIDLAEYLELRFADTALGKYWLKQIPKSKKQVVCRWQDEESGLNMQIKIDCLLPGVFNCDLKSTASRIEAFNDTAKKYSYDWQEALYKEGYQICSGEDLPFLFAIGETSGLKRAGIRTLPAAQTHLAMLNIRLARKGIASGDFAAPDALDTQAKCEDLRFWEAERIENATQEALARLES